MTVEDLVAWLRQCRPDAIVRAAFDVNDHDTTWQVYTIENADDEVILRAR